MNKTFSYISSLILGIVLYSCANMGRPTGGPLDYLPPVFIKATPSQGAKNVSRNKIELEFDELIQLKDQNDKVVVSPLQSNMPSIRTNGHKVIIELKDTLIPNTTYSIDFSDAIQDYTEGNPIENFSYAFSTGNEIDSLQISGILLDSRTLEPQPKMLVGVHTNLSDSAFYKIPLLRIAKTNELGQFSIRNLKPGKYNLFAINDIDKDSKFANPSEDIAFYGTVIEPKAERTEVLDTILTATHKIDTVLNAVHTRFYPNDILLSMFNENHKSQYLVKNERIDSTRIYLEFAAPADTLPAIKLLNFTPERKDWYKLERSETNDTLTYWLTDKKLMKLDSIKLAATFLRTDTAQRLVSKTDTLLFKLKKFKPKKEKSKKKEENDSIEHINFMNFNVASQSSQDVNLPVLFRAGTPVERIDSNNVHLAIKVDSLWQDVPGAKFKRSSELSNLSYQIDYDWAPGESYKLSVDSASVHDIYGLFNKPIEHTFTVKNLEDYSALMFTVNAPDSSVVELLDGSEKILQAETVSNGKVEFDYINPGTYYARLYIDRNKNGKYDTGNYAEKIQPEDVFYYNKKLVLKKNWDVSENWDIYAVPVDKQKPAEIKKNKPSAKKWEKKETQKKSDDDEEEETGFGANQFDNNYKNPFQ